MVVAGVIAALATQVSGSELFSAIFLAETLFALEFSLAVSCAAMAMAIVLGICSAYFLARHRFPGRGVLDTVLDIPLVMPPLVAGVGLLFLLGHNMLGETLSRPGASVCFHSFGSGGGPDLHRHPPIVIRNATAAFESVDPGYERGGQNLGVGPFTDLFENQPAPGPGAASFPG